MHSQDVYSAGIERFPSYLFLDDGRVYSFRLGACLKPLLTNGYHNVVLVEDGVKHRIGVHRLIAEAFIGEPKSDQVVNHKNGDRRDNDRLNLEWVTQSENVQHAYRHGLRTINKGHKERCAELGRSKRKTTSTQDELIRSMRTGKRGDIARISSVTGLSRDIVSRAIKEG